MKADDNRSKGKAGLAVAIGYYGSIGYTVNVPLNDTQDYDLIIDDGNTLKKVQVRCTGAMTKYGSYTVSLRSCGGTNGSVYSYFIDTNVDILFVVCTNGWLFEIPKENITQRSSINVNKVKPKFSTSEDYSKYMVQYEFIAV